MHLSHMPAGHVTRFLGPVSVDAGPDVPRIVLFGGSRISQIKGISLHPPSRRASWQALRRGSVRALEQKELQLPRYLCTKGRAFVLHGGAGQLRWPSAYLGSKGRAFVLRRRGGQLRWPLEPGLEGELSRRSAPPELSVKRPPAWRQEGACVGSCSPLLSLETLSRLS